ncbi:MAG: hypothetical protein FJ257_12175 [Phycisphaerae bacterium]|nr:hypothetical protein [Phycisphaerae bacterium]
MAEWIADLKIDGSLTVPNDLLEAGRYASVVVPEVEVGAIGAKTRYELAHSLARTLTGFPVARLYDDRGIWSWLSLHCIDIVMPATRGRRTPGELARYLPSERWDRRYRHLLRGPWHLVATALADGTDPAIYEPFLANPPDRPGELYEQFFSRVDQAASPGVLAAVRALYFDETTKRLKRGTNGKSAGSARRFGKVLNQLLLTYQVPTASMEGILRILPAREFSTIKASLDRLGDTAAAPSPVTPNAV